MSQKNDGAAWEVGDEVYFVLSDARVRRATSKEMEVIHLPFGVDEVVIRRVHTQSAQAEPPCCFPDPLGR